MKKVYWLYGSGINLKIGAIIRVGENIKLGGNS